MYKSQEGYEAMQRWYDQMVAALPIPVEARVIPTSFGETHLLTAGVERHDRPPLVMIQGFGASAPLWKNQIAAFAEHYRLYALDVPGHPGRSAPTVLSLLDDSYARWLVEALDALAIERAHLVGVCLGGWIAMQGAIFAPQRVDRLVLLSPVGLAQFKVFVRSGVPLILNFGRDNDSAGRRLLKMAFTPPGSGLEFDRDVAKALMLVIRHYDISALAGFDGARPSPRDLWMAGRALMKFVRPESVRRLSQISAPTLLLVGEHEAIYNPRAAVRRAQRGIARLDAEIVTGTGHATIYDRPDYINPRVLAFLDGAS
jgi:pimeloyl-ACP methyl ester carboxylesterase